MASLDLFNETLGKPLAAHLLRRATYRITPGRIDQFAELTAEQAVELLFQEVPLQFPLGPVSWVGINVPIFNIDSRYDGAYFTEPNINKIGSRTQFVHTWRMLEAIHDTTAKWKIIHWFSSIYSDRPDGQGKHEIYHQWRLFEKMAFGGDLKQLAVKITTDNRMLEYLNNEENKLTAPNENYSREFLELFTILKGVAIETGNYTNYTEEDVSTAALVLTGFVKGNISDPDTGVARGKAQFANHSPDNKTFSAAFGNRTITGAIDENDMFRELADFVDMVFDQIATARAYVRRMYIYFVSDKLSGEVENDIITPLSNELQANGYQHVPIIKKLLKSKHFYDKDDDLGTDDIIGGKIKSPYELFMQTINLFGLSNIALGQNDYEELFYRQYDQYAEHINPIGLDIIGPLSVENFPGFFKEPNYSRNWFSSNVLFNRLSFGESVIRGKVLTSELEFAYKGDIVEWVKTHVDNIVGSPGTNEEGNFNPIGASNYRRVVKIFAESFLPTPALFYSEENPDPDPAQSNERLAYIENCLLGGLSPVNWYFAWVNYITGDTDDSDVRVGIERLVRAITSSLEYQTF